MQLTLDDDQQLLAQTASSFVRKGEPLARLRSLRDSADARGYSRDVYGGMAELGFTAIPFAESEGGLGLGLASFVLVTEALGRGLAPEPLIPSVALAGKLLALGGTAAHKVQQLAGVIAGEKVIALAYSERGSRFDLARVECRAKVSDAGYTLDGAKTHVWGGALADAFIVAARTSGEAGDAKGISLFLVPGDARGLQQTRETRVDAQNAATLRLEGVSVGADALIGAPDEGLPLLEQAVDYATVALCGEMLGGASEAFERTVAYLKERKQFGVAIGSFQALKHRAARLYVELELARSAVMAAARALDAGEPDARSLVSLAKARLSDAYVLVANEAVQMHGGIGMTDEHDIGLYMKRARACEMTFGDAAFHRDRFARLAGY